ncbi:hypothetical protein [Serinicoccus chungangensis]|uniref:hypothetical protein n=1 Tax=Serinicoccus chungangensis TaxID=767452 RepID=UPI00111B4089|nr:hypothetical protein [Serinicoccus chungangensis]
MTRNRRPILAVTTLSLAALLSACGDAGGTEGEQAATPTQSDDAGGGGAGDEDTGSGADESEDPSMSTGEPGVGDRPTQTQIAPGGGDVSLPLGPVPDAVVQRPDVQEAIEAEAQRTGVEPEAVTVAGYADVTWSDGSIGCPKPGMMYTQALVPGHQLVLEVDGSYASYHAADGKPFSYCAQPVGPATSQSSGGPVTDR